jgi:large conductance mechanosensitive channel
MKQLLDEFKTFILRGNIVDLAVAVVIGLAFTELVKAAVDCLISPLLGMILAGKGLVGGPLDMRWLKLGSFIDAAIKFVITAGALNRLVLHFRKKEETPAPPATLNDVVAELREVKEELQKARGGMAPPPIL